MWIKCVTNVTDVQALMIYKQGSAHLEGIWAMLVEKTVADRRSGELRTGTGRNQKPLRDLLVVSGLSCSGKTTFMTQLAAGQLPKEIQKLLPPGVEAWPQGDPLALSNLINAGWM